ncbi:formylmethanofuran--tetrahydromethanopterin N-formyltransferase [Blastopirellula sp. J2-11]|uniref:formylmethanofuran--tetrahydromethanopterin N-formyltransferase n=1 Tax=Blastopirellula sp. J2-11 TaxID=2943192 RepID=UPI0021C5B6CA|nr:formylmethanofuran--tetrahydromethanopterin N-formyltransferase [Blastopirellula sp. J2-11]UUO05487.1 formylmethanofuran--tetrahydromethanopterin N-formyltransferase [Blastopirellula sp. J2-11]
MKIGSTQIVETFAEAFGMRYCRVIVTAHDRYWLEAATRELCGYGSSVIACDAEVGVERWLSPDQSPDGRVGVSILAFGFSTDALGKAISNRIGQCVMTCASTAVFDGLSASEERVPLGKQLRFFGDGFQKSKVVAGRRYWRIPVMDGEFLCEESLGVAKGVAGGNILIQAVDQATTLDAARRGVIAIEALADAITPFPAGVARSGSKVGSRYKGLRASTADAYCPTLRSRVESKVVDGANCVLEIVIDGATEAAVAAAMKASLHAAAGEGVLAISAGNYGGKLGKFHFHLHELLS